MTRTTSAVSLDQGRAIGHEPLDGTPCDRTESCFMSLGRILITGCSSGIGLAAARALKARGWTVLPTARKAGDLAMLRAEGFEPIALELADGASIDACAATALERTAGEINALFNNAAYAVPGAVEDLEVEALRRIVEVNVFGWHRLTRHLIPAFRARRQGRIVQCSSVLGLVSGRYRGAYAATKYAIEALSDAMRLELRGSGVTVSLIEPGPIRTRFLASAIEHFRAEIDPTHSPHRQDYEARMATLSDDSPNPFKLGPEAVVAKLIHALEHPRPKPRYYVTALTPIAAALKRVLPSRLLDLVLERAFR
jgi:NAD(P)-dependent dehydrogenase (short-subunit alcohol dehydrogenase family)